MFWFAAFNKALCTTARCFGACRWTSIKTGHHCGPFRLTIYLTSPVEPTYTKVIQPSTITYVGNCPFAYSY
jgi:hypothetical protein